MQEEKIKGRVKEKVKTEEGNRFGAWVSSHARHFFFGTLFFSGAFLLGEGRLLFGSAPLGIALLCGTGTYTLSILLGLIASALTEGDAAPIYILVYVAAAVMRILSGLIADKETPRALLREVFGSEVRERLGIGEAERHRKEGVGEARTLISEVRGIFCESVGLRMATAGVCALTLSVYRMIVGGFRFYDFFGGLFCVTVAAAATAVFSVALDDRSSFRPLRLFSEAALLFSLVWSSRELLVFSLALSPILSFVLCLCAARRKGAFEGICTALLCGLAHNPMNAPAYLLLVLGFLFFYSMGREGAGLFFGSLCALLWSVYAMGAAVLFEMIPTALIALVSYSLVWRLPFLGKEREVACDGEERSLDELKYRDANDRFRGISDAFSSLSEVFYNLSDRFRRPGTLDLRRVCDSAFDTHCADCPNKTVCWGLEYAETLATVNSLISALHTKGEVTASNVEGTLQQRCQRMPDILECINRECTHLTGELLRNNRTEILAMDYEGAAKIISDALEADDGEYRFDTALERRISEYLSDAGVGYSGVTVYGSRRRRILVRGADVENAKVTAEVLRSDLGEMCGARLERPTIEIEHGVGSMVFCSGQKLRVRGAQNNISADGGISGDSVNLFSNKKDYFYALISDGMGAGHEAALTSGLCSVFLEKMLRAGNRAKTSLRMLNNMIRSRGADSTRECSSTVDLLELDLMTGECTFIKSGAAPSFVVREGRVQRMQAGTVPIGIICALDAKETTFALSEGDTVIMVSDGVIECDGDGEWLVSFLSGVGELTPEEIVYNICLHAAAHDGHDDCSAIALRIEGADE